jgi:hypothetical protein
MASLICRMQLADLAAFLTLQLIDGLESIKECLPVRITDHLSRALFAVNRLHYESVSRNASACEM